MSDVVKPDAEGWDAQDSTTSRKEAFQKKMLAEIVRIDNEAAMPLLAEWQTYAALSADGVGLEFHSLAEYLPHRRKEAGIP